MGCPKWILVVYWTEEIKHQHSLEGFYVREQRIASGFAHSRWEQMISWFWLSGLLQTYTHTKNKLKREINLAINRKCWFVCLLNSISFPGFFLLSGKSCVWSQVISVCISAGFGGSNPLKSVSTGLICKARQTHSKFPSGHHPLVGTQTPASLFGFFCQKWAQTENPGCTSQTGQLETHQEHSERRFLDQIIHRTPLMLHFRAWGLQGISQAFQTKDSFVPLGKPSTTAKWGLWHVWPWWHPGNTGILLKLQMCSQINHKTNIKLSAQKLQIDSLHCFRFFLDGIPGGFDPGRGWGTWQWRVLGTTAKFEFKHRSPELILFLFWPGAALIFRPKVFLMYLSACSREGDEAGAASNLGLLQSTGRILRGITGDTYGETLCTKLIPLTLGK